MSSARKQLQHQETHVEFRGSTFTAGGHQVTMLDPNAGAKPAAQIDSDVEKSQTYQKWGASNDEPVVTRLKIEGSNSAFPLIVKSVEMMYGRGLTYYVEERTNSGIHQNWNLIQEVEDFLEANDMDEFILERLMDYRFHNNLFTEFILDKQGKKIVNLYHLESEFSRKGDISGDRVSNLKYRPNWSKTDDEATIPFLSKREAQDVAFILKTAGTIKKFAMHHHFPSPGRTLYAKAPHAALLETDGWLDYASSIPKILNAINRNANQIKFHVEIPGDYWERSVPGYDSMDAEAQAKVRDDKLTEMDEWFKGAKNAHDTFISHFAVDHTGKYLSGWKITPLNVKAKSGEFLTELQEADVQIARGLGMDVSLAGIQPAGGKMGAGSGSDKRTAFTNAVSMSYAAMKVVLDPLYVVARVNGWPKGLKFALQHDIPTTLNDEPSGVKKVEP